MRVAIVGLIGLALVGTALHLPAAAHQTYAGICDASAAIAIDDAHFLVAEDELNILRLYRNDNFRKGEVKAFSFDEELKITDPDKPELDIEGAARIGDRVYWITSHGRSKKGKQRMDRYRLFATDIAGTSADLELTWVGQYSDLVQDMLNKNAWSNPDAPDTQDTIRLLADATQLDEKRVRKLAPKKQGLNIEALAALPDGSGLLIGLRNPIPGGKALVIPLKNPEAVVTGRETAHFDKPFELDLDGLGLRGMDYAPNIQAFLLVAGPPNGGDSFKLFQWNGAQDGNPVLIGKLDSEEGSNPETVVVYPNSSRIQILHDEGSMIDDEIDDETACKDIDDAEDKRFSGRWYVVK